MEKYQIRENGTKLYQFDSQSNEFKSIYESKKLSLNADHFKVENADGKKECYPLIDGTIIFDLGVKDIDEITYLEKNSIIFTQNGIAYKTDFGFGTTRLGSEEICICGSTYRRRFYLFKGICTIAFFDDGKFRYIEQLSYVKVFSDKYLMALLKTDDTWFCVSKEMSYFSGIYKLRSREDDKTRLFNVYDTGKAKLLFEGFDILNVVNAVSSRNGAEVVFFDSKTVIEVVNDIELIDEKNQIYQSGKRRWQKMKKDGWMSLIEVRVMSPEQEKLLKETYESPKLLFWQRLLGKTLK